MRFEELTQDVAYAWRTLRKDRSFSILVIATLALGIAANATIFSLMNPYLFRQLPFGDADALVQLEQVKPVAGWDHDRLSLGQYLDWKERSRAFVDVGAYYYGTVNVTGAEDPERIGLGYLTANMFSVLEAQPLIGRSFLPGEDGPAGADVVILGHGLWQRRYLGDPGIIGETISIDGVTHTVIGVMPPRFNFPFGGIKMWKPMPDDPAQSEREANYMLPIGRLAHGWTAERARDELTTIQSELAAIYPHADGQFAGVTVRPVREALNFAYDILSISFVVVLIAVVAVLMIACVNVASLTLARASNRTREVAVRAAIGAGRGRLVRQFLTESFMLAVVGGSLGVLLTFWAARLIGPILPEDLYRVGEVSVDLRVLAFAVAVTLATPIFFGLAPAITATRADLNEALKAGTQGSSGGHSSLRGRRALVVLEVAMAIVLISGAGLMIRSFVQLRQVDLGFDADHLLTVEITPPESDYEGRDQIANYFDRATTATGALPGVRAASTIRPLPLNHETAMVQFALPGREPAGADQWPVALHLRAGAGLFETMGVRLLAGREFNDADGPDGPTVVIVSRKLADRGWPGEDPVGRTLLFGDPGDPTRATVVGVVDDIKHSGIANDNRPQLWQSLPSSSSRRRFLVASVDGSPSAHAASVRRALRAIDPNLPVNIRPMSAVVMENTLQWSIPSAFLSVFGLVALSLAALGIYGVIAYSVARRRREMGIRVALGADAAQIRKLVLGEGLRLTGIGIGLGLAVTIAAGQVMASLLFGIGPFDPVTLGGVLLLFLGVSVVACLVPALKAAEANPQAVLRTE